MSTTMRANDLAVVKEALEVAAMDREFLADSPDHVLLRRGVRPGGLRHRVAMTAGLGAPALSDDGGAGSKKRTEGGKMSDERMLRYEDEDKNDVPATTEQAAASDAAAAKDGGAGIILVDEDGDVVTPGSWDAQHGVTFRAWVE